jgi:hypothetical protein
MTLAAAGLLAAFSCVAAQAETCSLAQMASLDMTILPDGRFAVPVTINSTQHEFLVDTSGVFSAITGESVEKLGLKEAPTNMEMYGVNGKERISTVDVDSFKVGNNEATHFHLMGYRPNPQPQKQDEKSESQKIDGILAPDFLNLFDIELDFANKKMNLFSQDHCPGKVVYWTRGGFAELPFHHTGGVIAAIPHIDFQMTLDGQDVSTDLDTGSATSWLRHKMALQVFGVDETSPGVTKSALSTDAMPVYHKQFGSLTLGGLSVQNPQVDIIVDQMENAFRMEHSEKSRDDPMYGSHLSPEQFTLGMNVLSKLHLFIAYKEHVVYLTAADAH